MRASGRKVLYWGLAVALCLIAVEAQANDILALHPGDSTSRDFLLDKEFNTRRLEPMETFLVLGAGDSDTQSLLGELTILLRPTVIKTSEAIVEYTLIGFVFPLGGNPGGKAVFINARASVPQSLLQPVTIRAPYGLALLIIYIKTITGDVTLPVQFSMTVRWAGAR